MILALSYMTLGFLLGLRHAADADHVIAVTSIVTRHRTVRAGVLVGAVWGFGHTLTILLVGGSIVVFRIVIPPMLGLTMELAVAVMLVVLGVSTLRALRDGSDALARAAAHDHCHGPLDEAPDVGAAALAGHRVLRPLGVGLVHGLAGSAAVALLVLGMIEDTRWAVAYLVLFGSGTIVGMIVIAAAIAAPLAYVSRRSPRVERHVRMASGLLSVGAGLLLVYQLGFADGFFAGTALWTAR